MEEPNSSGSPGKGLGPTGARIFSRRMLGDAGAAGTGKGSWVGIEALKEKTFFLHTVDQALALGTPTVLVHGAMELDPVDPDANTDVALLATLNAAGPFAAIDSVWRFVRVEVTGAGTNPIQVGMTGLGL